MAIQAPQPPPNPGQLYLLGAGVTHSIAPPMHNVIADALSLPWKFSNLECPTIQDVLRAINSPSFAGGVITMPYKQAIIPHLSGIDPYAATIGAVNNIYRTADGKLRGTNTDWEGIKGCLLSADPQGQGRGRPALIIGAGGASRAAIYALTMQLGVHTIYVINRDAQEVTQLLQDTSAYPPSGRPQITHVTTPHQAQSLPPPFYIVGTVPDLPPTTPPERTMRDILEVFLDAAEPGVLLDMCFKPRNTRTLRLGRAKGWACVDGTDVIGYQFPSQWYLWTGGKDNEEEDVRGRIPREEAWAVLRKGAEESPTINF